MKFRKRISSGLFNLWAVLVVAGWASTALSQSPHGSPAPQPGPAVGGGYIPQRVYDANEKRFTDFEGMLAELAKVDVVFVGEQHNDQATHQLEYAVLEGLARRRENVVVAMEMFERDVQRSLDDYLAGGLSEEDFLRVARPWPNYLTDYRPIVEFARVHGWPVVASNVPRRYASQVSKQGLGAVDSVPQTERYLIASQIQCPLDDYYKRFAEVMVGGHPGSHPPDAAQSEEMRAMLERFYFAQCIKDETMAESVAGQFSVPGSTPSKPLIVHFNGAFHSDYKLGTAARAYRRLPKSKIKVVTLVPIDNFDTVKADEYRKRGDYVVFTLKPMELGQAQKADRQ